MRRTSAWMSKKPRRLRVGGLGGGRGGVGGGGLGGGLGHRFLVVRGSRASAEV